MRKLLLKKSIMVFVACIIAMLTFVTIVVKANQLLATNEGILTSCDIIRGRLCVMSFGQVEGDTFVGLRSTEQFDGDLKLFMNQQMFSCKSSSFDTEFIYCTGPLIQDNSTVLVEAFSQEGSLIASGMLTVDISSFEQGNGQPTSLYPYPYYLFMSIIYKSFPFVTNP